ncbi:MAG: diguanylate cyclase [Sphaerochaetaceae bacterium]|nr:diguanylate cyclase [Sphaerochaetaceae bacterium]
MRTGRILTWKHILFLILFLTIAVSLSFPAFYLLRRTKAVLTEEVGSKAVDIAHTISSVLEMEIDMYRKLSETENLNKDDELWPYYQKLNEMMRSIKRKADADFIFTGRYIDDQTSGYVLDGEDPESELFSPFGSTDGMNPTELLAYQQQKSMASDVETDPDWGSFLTGYSPIIDYRDGTMVGLVGVDYSADFIQDRIKRIAQILIISFALITLLTSIALETIILIAHEKAHTDELTKLGNKRAFNRALKHLHSQAIRFKRPYAVLLMDIDLFKNINDEYGHPVGDKVLVAVAKAILYASDQEQFCFRYGGDEFAVLIPQAENMQALRVKRMIQEEVRNIIIPELGMQRFTVSIGSKVWNKGSSIEDMISEADVNLYKEKRNSASSLS